MTRNSVALPLLLIALAVLSRWIPHIPNFAPMGAIALFSGARFAGGSKKWALIVPLLALLISDFVLGFYDGMIWTYASFICVAGIGFWVSRSESALRIGAGAVLSSLVFFVLSNWGVWLSTDLYARNLSGLVECYIAAIPFYRLTLSGDLLYSAALFGVYHSVLRFSSQASGQSTA